MKEIKYATVLKSSGYCAANTAGIDLLIGFFFCGKAFYKLQAIFEIFVSILIETYRPNN
jgi:hypothetical protein